MLTKFSSGRVYDPTAGWRGEVRDLYVQDGRFIARPDESVVPDRTIDLDGSIVMAGAIDLHTHIGGGKVTLAKMLLPEAIRRESCPGGAGGFLPTTRITGQRYAAMGYSACFEPAVIACNARQAHAEMADTPLIDTGGYCLLGNDDRLLRMIGSQVDQAVINDYVAWMVTATQCLAVKVVNAGGISAFKFNQRQLDVDTPHPAYGTTPGQVIRVLARAVHEIGLPHPLHVHCSNLGIAGNIESTLKTIEAADGLPLHLTHVQFHSYGDEGPHGFSSAAQRIADALRKHPQVTIDVGQVMFGQTVTISADTMHQYASRGLAKPRKSVLVDIECEGGCGVVPFRYRKRRFVNALQWAIGLELFLMVDDPSRVFLTTDHPNGGPFTTYPHLLRLLGDRSFRETALAEIHPDAAAASQLAGFDREYGIDEIAMMTRAAPARILGLTELGRLTPGAIADLTVYREAADLEKMFARPAWFYRHGEAVVRDGQVIGEAPKRTWTARPAFDAETPRRLADAWQGPAGDGSDFQTLWIDDDEMAEMLGTSVATVPTERTR